MRKTLLLAFSLLLFSTSSQAVPRGTFVNPLTETAWGEILPFKLAGVTLFAGSGYDTPDYTSGAICTCPLPPPIFRRIGVPISYWEPNRVVETVKDPFFFPSLGFSVSSSSTGKLMGTSQGDVEAGSQHTTFQSHWLIYPVWAILGVLTDMACAETSGFDVAYMTEVDPLWQDDSLSMLLHPEVLLFSNPIAQMACVADAVSVNLWRPLEALFWCVGSSGSAYPMNGHVANENIIQASMTAASRTIYKLSRMMLLWDLGLWYCAPVPTPIWVKPNYKLQPQRPLTRMKAYPVGKSSWFYQAGANPATGTGQGSSDNFSWLVFRKRICCFM